MGLARQVKHHLLCIGEATYQSTQVPVVGMLLRDCISRLMTGDEAKDRHAPTAFCYLSAIAKGGLSCQRYLVKKVNGDCSMTLFFFGADPDARPELLSLPDSTAMQEPGDKAPHAHARCTCQVRDRGESSDRGWQGCEN